MIGPCLICGTTPKRLHGDHCHRHDRQRGQVCPRCNALMRWIDQGNSPQVPPDVLQALIAQAARCQDCPPVDPAALIPTGLPAKDRRVLHLEIGEDLEKALRAFAAARGISVSAAVRLILHERLTTSQPDL